MIVRCSQCSTQFSFDERQIDDDGVTVRCSVCRNVFRVELEPVKPVPWQIQTVDGALFSAPDLPTLREWIAEGRLHPDDKVSRTGRNWVRLAEMPEFASAFEGFMDVPAGMKAVQPRVEVGATIRPVARDPEWRPEPPPDFGIATTDPLEDATARRSPATPMRRPIDEDALTRPRPAVSAEIADSPAATPIADATMGPGPARSVEIDRDALAETRRYVPVEEAPRRRGIGPGLVALLGAVAAIGVVFGVPSIRHAILGEPASETPDTPAAPAAAQEVELAEEATRKLGLGGLARAEAALQRKLDGSPDEATRAGLQVALADLLFSRSLAYEIAASLNPTQADAHRNRARDDREDGERLLDSLAGSGDADRMAEIRALARLAAGRDPVEVLPLVPIAATETELIVRGAPLWRDPAAKVPPGLIEGLQGLEARSGLGDSVLALALIRAEDRVAATNLLERLLVSAEDHIVGVALSARLGGPTVAEPGETGDELPAGETGGVEPEAEAGEPGETGADPTPTSPKGGTAGSFDKLVERGCDAARSGSADTGIKLLLKAFDDKPTDLDVLVCLGDGYVRQGNNRRAADFYDKALARAPKFKPALAGAAEVAAKTGAKSKALKLYETLLDIDPGHPDAKAYVAEHGGGGDPPASADTTSEG